MPVSLAVERPEAARSPGRSQHFGASGTVWALRCSGRLSEMLAGLSRATRGCVRVCSAVRSSPAELEACIDRCAGREVASGSVSPRSSSTPLLPTPLLGPAGLVPGESGTARRSGRLPQITLACRQVRLQRPLLQHVRRGGDAAGCTRDPLQRVNPVQILHGVGARAWLTRKVRPKRLSITAVRLRRGRDAAALIGNATRCTVCDAAYEGQPHNAMGLALSDCLCTKDARTRRAITWLQSIDGREARRRVAARLQAFE